VVLAPHEPHQEWAEHQTVCSRSDFQKRFEPLMNQRRHVVSTTADFEPQTLCQDNHLACGSTPTAQLSYRISLVSFLAQPPESRKDLRPLFVLPNCLNTRALTLWRLFYRAKEQSVTVEPIGQKGDTSFSLKNEILAGENAKGQVTLTEPGYVDHSRLMPIPSRTQRNFIGRS
jgi:hypothetical protein